eukprot:5504479-Prymnesium_polylepis.1
MPPQPGTAWRNKQERQQERIRDKSEKAARAVCTSREEELREPRSVEARAARRAGDDAADRSLRGRGAS